MEKRNSKVAVHSRISENAKRIIATKLIYDAKNKNLVLLVCTHSKLFIQDVEDTKSFRVLFDCSEIEDLYISGIYEGDVNSTQNIIYLILNEINLVELDLSKSDTLPNSILTQYFNKKKQENKSKTVSFEYYSLSNISSPNSKIVPSFTYSSIFSLEEKTAKSIWRFNEKIITLKQRPKLNSEAETKNNNTHLSISFSGGYLRVFHLESKLLIYNYKTKYGNIICIEYSENGRLLGLGTESDEVYIIDADSGSFLFCLEGHKNYVTNIFFLEVVNNEEESDKLNPLPSERCETNDNLGNYNSITKSYPVTNKELTLENFVNFCMPKEDSLDLKQLRRTRTSSKKNNLGFESDEIRFSTSYDVFTAGLDGNLAVWRIEHFYEDDLPVNNYVISGNVIKKEMIEPVLLFPIENMKVFYNDMVKISKGPIMKLVLCENTIALSSKRNAFASYCNLTFFSETSGKLDDAPRKDSSSEDKFNNSNAETNQGSGSKNDTPSKRKQNSFDDTNTSQKSKKSDLTTTGNRSRTPMRK